MRIKLPERKCETCGGKYDALLAPRCENCNDRPRRYLAVFDDATGLPRAYGLAIRREDAEARAARELEAYRAGTSYYPAAQEPFALRVEEYTK